MTDVQNLLEDISKGFPSSHVVRDYLESGTGPELEAAELYLRQKHSNYGLSPEDESNLEMLVEILEEPGDLEEIYQGYQED